MISNNRSSVLKTGTQFSVYDSEETQIEKYKSVAIYNKVDVPVYTTTQYTIYELVSVEARAYLPLESSNLDYCSIMFLIKARHANGTSGQYRLSGKFTATISGTDYTILDTASSGTKLINMSEVDNYILDDSGNPWNNIITNVPFDTTNRGLSVKIKGENVKILSDIVINFEGETYLQEIST